MGSFYLPLIWAVLFLGLGTTLFGLYEMPLWSATLLTKLGALGSYLPVIIVVAFVFEKIIRWLKINRLVMGGMLILFLAIISNSIWPLIVCVWFFVASLSLGRFLLSALRVNVDELSELSVLLVGAGAYGTAVGLLAHYPVNYPGLYVLALVIPVFMGREYLKQHVFVLRKKINFNSDFRILDWAIAIMALTHFAVALMPEVGHDALAMHLFIPNHMAYRHEWGFDASTYVWAVMPMLGDWIYSIGYMLGGETASRLLNLGFIFIVSCLLHEIVIWAGGNKQGSRWAVLIFLTTPLTFTESSSLFIESVWTVFVVAGALSIFKISTQGENRKEHLYLSAALLAFAVTTKAVSLTILPLLLLLLIIRYRTWFKKELYFPIILGFVLFVLVGGIPYLTAWYLTENPIFPFYNAFFESPLYPSVNFKAGFVQGVSWDIIYQTTFHSEKYMESRMGATGFQWLILFLPALLFTLFTKKYKGLLLFVIAILAIVLTFNSTAYLRYIFPSFVWVAAGIGVVLSFQNYKYNLLAKIFYVAAGVVVILNLAFFKTATSYGGFSFRPILSSEGRENYINKRLPIRRAVKLVNQVNTSNAPVAIFSSPLTAGLNANALYPNWYNHNFSARVREINSVEEMAMLLIDMDISYVVLDSVWGDDTKRAYVESVTIETARFGAVSVRRLHNKYQYTTELLENSDFTKNKGWNFLVAEFEHLEGSVVVNVSNPAIQLVDVKVGKRYKNEVTASCENDNTQGRMQVNWLDSKSLLISADIQLFDCNPVSKTYSMEIIAPSGAAKAVVYAVGHTKELLTINKVSFRK